MGKNPFTRVFSDSYVFKEICIIIYLIQVKLKMAEQLK